MVMSKLISSHADAEMMRGVIRERSAATWLGDWRDTLVSAATEEPVR